MLSCCTPRQRSTTVVPWREVKAAASRCPLVPAPRGAVVVTGAANVAAVSKDWASFRNEPGPPKPGTPVIPGDGYVYRPHGPLMMRGVTALPVTFTPAAPQ